MENEQSAITRRICPSVCRITDEQNSRVFIRFSNENGVTNGWNATWRVNGEVDESTRAFVGSKMEFALLFSRSVAVDVRARVKISRVGINAT